MRELVNALSRQWKLNGDYGLSLTADLNAADFVDQPTPGANHPAWILSHLNTYHVPIAGVVRNEAFADPRGATFGMGSKPVADASVYKSPQALREDFAAGHALVQKALDEATDKALMQPTVLERWRERMPLTAEALMYLMVRHEALHLGQLSAWRRLRGLPAV